MTPTYTLAPLISCICITSNRPLLLQRAIVCFDTQDYPIKELVISYPDNDFMTRNILNWIEEISDIKMIRIERPEEEKLGSARNNAIALANGEFICIWDDDDWFDSTRISRQYMVLKNNHPFKASILSDIFLYDSLGNKTYYSDMRECGGTLLCEKQTMLQTPYLNLEKNEDTLIIPYLTYKNLLFRIIEMPYLYISVYHGDNALGQRHFNLCFMLTKMMEESVNTQVQAVTDLNQYLVKDVL